MKYSDLTNGTKQSIIKDYQSGLTQIQVCEKYGFGLKLLKKVFLKADVPFRKKGGRWVAGNRFNFNLNFFNEMTEVTAYWAGFMMADGSLVKNKHSYRLALNIHETDRHHLELFCESIEAQEYNTHATRPGMVMVRFCYTEFGPQLQRWGVVPNKTYNFVEPNIHHRLLPHYLRGWFDGDGNISLFHGKERFRVTGNPLALKWYAESLKTIGFSGNYSFYQKSRAKWAKIDISGFNQLKEVVELLYFPNSIYLARKWDSVLQFLKDNPLDNCMICGKTLRRGAKSGYCQEHYEQSPQRQQSNSRYYGVPFNYCKICDSKLSRNNKTGYCIEHRELSPYRKQQRREHYQELRAKNTKSI